MPDDYVDPIEELSPAHRVEPFDRTRASGQGRRHPVTGEVVAVHPRTVRREPGHVLDATVGGQSFDEIVVRVQEGEVGELIGKRVKLIIED